MRDRVAGVDHQVGFEGVERGDPADQAAAARRQVGVRDVQDLQRPLARGQDGYVVAAQAEPVALDDGCVTDPGDAGAEHCEGDGVSLVHLTIVPDPETRLLESIPPPGRARWMTMLKEKLRTD